MATDARLEAYLSQLDKALGPIPVSDRADILIEIKSHVLESLERDPTQNLDRVLSALGQPETVANRYLLERGLKLTKPSRSPIVKWLTIGFLGTFAMACLTLVLLVWKFSPLIQVDEKNGRVILLGGLIDVSSMNAEIKLSDGALSYEMDARQIQGTQLVAPDVKEIHIPFSNGKFTVSPSDDQELHWDCEVIGGSKESETVTANNGVVTLGFEKLMGAKCDIEVPKIKSVITGANGQVHLQRPASEMEVSVSNGQVEIEEDSKQQYRFDLKVGLGKVDQFQSTEKPEAIGIKVSLGNGRISKHE